MGQNLSITATNFLSKPKETTQPQKTLRDVIKELVWRYVTQLEKPAVSNYYQEFMAEIEKPMLEMVLQYVGQNQSKTARILKISRGTLRKKMQIYGLLP